MVKKGKKTSTKTVAKKAAKKTVAKSVTRKAAVKSTKKVAKKTVKKAAPKKAVTKVVKKKTAPKKTVKKVAKKTSKKVSPKKSPTKKTTKAVWEKKVSADVAFYTLNEKKLASIIDLVKEMEEMNEEVYHHHVSFQHNDFANWIEGVFGLAELAEDLRTSHSKDEMQLLLLKYIINNG